MRALSIQLLVAGIVLHYKNIYDFGSGHRVTLQNYL